MCIITTQLTVQKEHEYILLYYLTLHVLINNLLTAKWEQMIYKLPPHVVFSSVHMLIIFSDSSFLTACTSNLVVDRWQENGKLTIYITVKHSQDSVCLMVFNATFNNISVILWRSVLLVEETGGTRENHRPAASHWQTLSHNVLHLTLIEIRTHDRHWLHT